MSKLALLSFLTLFFTIAFANSDDRSFFIDQNEENFLSIYHEMDQELSDLTSEQENPLCRTILQFNSLLNQEAYPYNPHVPVEVWYQLSSYFLPADHPLKKKLDRIFSKNRAVLSKEAFTAAGFDDIKMRQPLSPVVGKHPQLTGFLVKAFLDNQPPLCEWASWVSRITGALAIKECLKRQGFKDFCVPKKWIYPLPESPSPPNYLASQRKNFILIVEDMHILSNHSNLKAYKETISEQQLSALFTILAEVGLFDSMYPDNIPFTKRGKIAFIDTEHHHQWPVKYHVLNRFLSPERQAFWQSLIDQDRRVD